MKTLYSQLLLLVLVALLAACGDSKTTINGHHVADPDEHHDDHGHDDDHNDDHAHEGSVHGRLVVTEVDGQMVYVLDTEDGHVEAELSVPALPTAIYPSPDYRYAAVIARDDNWVSFIDGGLSLEDHGDHQDLVSETPAIMDFFLDGVRPTHYTLGEDQIAVFYDGNGDLGEPAGVAVLTSEIIAGSGEPALLQLPVHQHGAAQARGEYLLASERDETTESVLPDRVGLYHQHGDHYDHELTFEETCPGLHGSAQNEDLVFFGCTDGVLVIDESQDFAVRKIANPGSFGGDMRIGSVYAHHHAETAVAVAGGQYFVLHPDTDTIEPLQWTHAGEAEVVGRGFAAGGEWFVLLQANGMLTVMDAHDWEEVGSLSLPAEGETAAGEAGYQLVLAPHGHMAYVLEAGGSHVHAIDLDHLEVEARWSLGFTPAHATWVGVSGGEEHH